MLSGKGLQAQQRTGNQTPDLFDHEPRPVLGFVLFVHPLYGPRLPGFASRAATSATMSSIDQSRSVTPAAIGVRRVSQSMAGNFKLHSDQAIMRFEKGELRDALGVAALGAACSGLAALLTLAVFRVFGLF